MYTLRHSTHAFRHIVFPTKQSMVLLFVLSGEAANADFKEYGLIRSVIQTTSYTQCNRPTVILPRTRF